MELTKDDMKNLDNLKAISKSIMDIEKSLSTLEFENKKDHPMYKFYLGKLKEIIDYENKIYESISDDHDKLNDYISYLASRENLYNLPSQMYTLIKNLENNIIVRRIAIKLRETDLENNSEELEELGKMPVIYVGNKKMSTNSKYGLMVVDQQIKKDIVNTILALINKTLKENISDSNRQFLIAMKYRIASLYKYTEEKLIADNFNIEDKVFWTSESTAYYHKIDLDFYKSYKHEVAAGLGTFAAFYLNDLDDSDFENPNIFDEIKFYQVLLRTSFLFRPLNSLKDLKAIAEGSIITKKMAKINYNGDQIIANTIDYANDDRKISQNILIKIRKKES